MLGRYSPFCFGVILVAAVLADAVSASAQTVELSPRVLDKADSRGTLVFGFRQELDERTSDEPELRFVGGSPNTRGALTMHLFGPGHFIRRLNRITLSPIRTDETELARFERPFSVTRTAGSGFWLQPEGGVTAMQIAFGSAEGVTTEEITPVSEVGTWLAAPLGMLVIGYSQRRRLGNLLRGLLRKAVVNSSANALPSRRLARVVSAG